ncbi:MAG: hypothetical protein ACR2JP_01000 [Acidimicrobiia bacterium]
MLRGCTRRSEGGAVLVMTAMLLLVFMGFAAIAVDAGIAWSDKRRVGTAADMASLGAAEAIADTLRSEVDGVVAGVATALVATNAPGATATVGPATGPGPGDPACADAQRECLTNVAVEVDDNPDEAFAPAIGASIDSVGASAEAQIYKIEYPPLKLLPIGVDDIGGPALRCAPVECKVHEEPPEPPPPSPTTTTTIAPPPPPEPPGAETIGSDDVDLLELRRLDTRCADAAGTTIGNLSGGADHLVGLDAAAGVRTEADACLNGHELTRPNSAGTLPSHPAVVGGGIQPMIPGPTGTHLWDFLTGTNVGPCDPSEFQVPPWVTDPETAFMRRTAAMANCFANGNPSLAIPFGDPRLGWAIELDGTNFARFVPVWIHSVMDQDAFGNLVISTTGDSGFSVFVLDEGMLPADAVSEVDWTGRLSFKLVD